MAFLKGESSIEFGSERIHHSLLRGKRAETE